MNSTRTEPAEPTESIDSTVDEIIFAGCEQLEDFVMEARETPDSFTREELEALAGQLSAFARDFDNWCDEIYQLLEDQDGAAGEA